MLALLAGSYPFDFASFAYQSRSFFEYGVHPLFYWNKGLPLLGLFYSQYSLYQLAVNWLTHSQENTVLLHFFYKFAFFAADILTAYFLAKIITTITGRQELARYGAFVWLLNPFLFWSVEFQGSYAIVAVLFSTVSLWLFLERKYAAAAVFLGLSASVYYYAAVFLPFYAIKLAYETKRHAVRRAALLVLIFCAAIAVFYLPYFFNAQFAHDLVQSLFYHSAPNASQFAKATPLPNYSLLKLPFYLVTHYFPTNQSAPRLFKVAGLITLLGVLAVGILALKTLRLYLRKKIYSLYSRRKTYDDERFIYDLLIAVTLFLLLIGNFQDHYLVWVFPYMVICAVAYRRHYMLRNMLLLAFAALFVIIGTNNLGVYLLDIIPFGTINVYLGQTQFVLALGGFVIMLLLATNLFVAHFKKSGTAYVLEEDYGWAMLPVAFCVVMGAVSLTALVMAANSHALAKLGSDAIVYDFAYAPATISAANTTTTVNRNVGIKDATFAAESPGRIKPNHYLNPRKSPWFLYNWQGPAANIASIVAASQGNSLKIAPKTPVGLQLNFGKSRSVMPVYNDRFYRFAVYIKNNGLAPNDYKASVRFVDQFNTVVPASDILLKPAPGAPASGSWVKYSADFIPPVNAFFVEPNFTVNIPQGARIAPGANVQFARPSLQDINMYQTITYAGLAATSNNGDINKYILAKPAIRYFGFTAVVPRDNYAEKLTGVSLNGCVTHDARFSGEEFDFTAQLKPACYKRNAANTLTFTTVNYAQQPRAQISLAHNPNGTSTVNYHRAAYKVFAAAGGVLSLLALAAVIVIIRKL